MKFCLIHLNICLDKCVLKLMKYSRVFVALLSCVLTNEFKVSFLIIIWYVTICTLPFNKGQNLSIAKTVEKCVETSHTGMYVQKLSFFL